MNSNPIVINWTEKNFRELFDTYVDRVQAYLFAVCHSHYIAEEVTQELFIILWRKRADLHEVQNMEQYLFRIARNLAIKLLKKAAIDGKKAAEWYKRLPGQADSVNEAMDQQNVQELINKAVNALPAQPQKVYFLSRREHMNFDEIAGELGLSRNTVKNHLNRALSDIREYLIQQGYQPAVISLILLGELSVL